MKAYKLQKKASKVGFDWDHIEGVFQKIEEELGELRQAVTEGQSDMIQHWSSAICCSRSPMRQDLSVRIRKRRFRERTGSLSVASAT